MQFGPDESFSYGLSDPVHLIDPLGLDDLGPLHGMNAFMDWVTFGGTKWIREQIGVDDVINTNSPWYQNVETAGEVADWVMAGKGLTKKVLKKGGPKLLAMCGWHGGKKGGKPLIPAAGMELGKIAKGSSKQMKKLTNGDVKKLKKKGMHPHDLKPDKGGGKYDLFWGKDGQIYVKPKSGKGPGDPTGVFKSDLE